MKKTTTILAAVLCTALSLNAVPARRGFFDFTQPDGSTVKVQLIGDEYCHYYLSDDNIILIPDADGTLKYAVLDAGGNPVAGDLKAQDSRTRGAEGKALTARLDQTKIREAFITGGNRSRQARAKARIDTRKAVQSRAVDAGNIPQSGLGRFTGDYPRTGKVHGIVFLVEYPNKKFTIDNPHEYFTRMLNEEGFNENGATGSARDYFLDQSNGKFDVTFDVYGPVTLPNNYSYYGANNAYGDDMRAEEMVIHAAQLLDNEINFADYDYDNNGFVDNIFVLYAGEGEATGGSANTVWPHSWEVPEKQQITLDGKTIAGYACSNEWEEYRKSVCGIGTVCHEFSHVMGLPDLYSTDSQLTCTPGTWSVMDYGSYNNNGNTPSAYSAFERNAMGWLDVKVLDGPATISLEPVNTSNTACLIPTTKTEEFFLLENRQQTGWDTYLPYHGMLIWHIDFNQAIWDNNTVNNNNRHQYVDIEEANQSPNNTSTTVMRGYPFPGTTGVTSFTSTTLPTLKTWNGKGIDMPVTDITESTDGIITFDVAGGHIELETPAAPILSANDKATLSISWQAVPKANEYLLSVFTRTDDGTVCPFGGYTDFNVGNVTATEVSGINGNTEYFATIQAKKGISLSDVSPEGSTVSPDIDIAYVCPTAISATADGTNNGTGNVTFKWQEIKNAAAYLITVEVSTGSEPQTVTVDGGSDGNELSLPEGWSWDGDFYTSRSIGYCGTSAPSFKFSSTGHTLTSPLFSNPVTALSYWLRGASPGGQSAIEVEGRTEADGSWLPIRTIILVNEAKTARTFTDEINDGYRQIRFVYNKVSGNAALDDIVITTLNDIYTPHKDYTRYNVGAVTSVTLPVSTSDCYFYIEAVDAEGRISLPSNKVRLTPSTSGIQNPTAVDICDEPVEYYNLQGIRVDRPVKGLYIRRQGNNVSKVFVK